MRTVTTTYLEFDELSEEAKKNAIEQHCERGTFDADSREIEEFLQQTCEEAGLEGGEVRFSLSYCQGDGASWVGNIDLDKFCKAQAGILREIESLPEDSPRRERLLTMLCDADLDVLHLLNYQREELWCGGGAYSFQSISFSFVKDYGCHYVHERSTSLSADLEQESPWSVGLDGESVASFKRAKAMLVMDTATATALNLMDAQLDRMSRRGSLRSSFLLGDMFNYTDALWSELEPDLTTWMVGFNRLLAQDGYDMIEFAREDDHIAEGLSCNSFEFDEDGNPA